MNVHAMLATTFHLKKRDAHIHIFMSHLHLFFLQGAFSKCFITFVVFCTLPLGTTLAFYSNNAHHRLSLWCFQVIKYLVSK